MEQRKKESGIRLEDVAAGYGPLHHAEQLIFSGRLVIRHCRLHHMACAVEFMAL